MLIVQMFGNCLLTDKELRLRPIFLLLSGRTRNSYNVYLATCTVTRVTRVSTLLRCLLYQPEAWLVRLSTVN